PTSPDTRSLHDALPILSAAAAQARTAIDLRSKLIAEKTPVERRRTSKKAAIVAPRQGFRLPKPIRRLQRQAPFYALQAVGDLSTDRKSTRLNSSHRTIS